ncbi:MAG: SUMF1/EgtB/PvdO family nonheme iron enzyme, partial [Methylococcaceae bacterium]|nr:SUMF1/EgtB/PvdO family nonheme iron enzyme [Methylococcaceae bacterium]
VPKSSQKEDYDWGLARFLQEAKTLALFKHDNITKVRDFFEANGTAYMVMDYEKGETFKDWLANFKLIASIPSERQLLKMIIPILEALDTLHKNNHLHLDIKPSNIYICSDGRPILIDFGTARQSFGNKSCSIRSVLSEGFAPKEQYSGRGNIGTWTDLYALSATLYYAITGKVPLPSPDRGEARDEGEADPLSLVSVEYKNIYSTHFLEAIDAGLSYLPKDRPQSIADYYRLLVNKEPTKIERSGHGSTKNVTKEALTGVTANDMETVIFDAEKLRVHDSWQTSRKNESNNNVLSTKKKIILNLLLAIIITCGVLFFIFKEDFPFTENNSFKKIDILNPNIEIDATEKIKLDLEVQTLKKAKLEAEVQALKKARLAAEAHALEKAKLDAEVQALKKEKSAAEAQALEKLKLEALEKLRLETAAKQLDKEVILYKESKKSGTRKAYTAYLNECQECIYKAEITKRLNELPKYAKGDKWLHQSSNMNFVWVPEGSFVIGNKDVSPRSDQHRGTSKIMIAGFFMGRTEVTIAQFRQFVEATDYYTQKGDGCDANGWDRSDYKYDYPVSCVSWNDAQAYIGWVNSLGKEKFALPSEAQWEYACRAKQLKTYCGGNSLYDAYGWGRKNSENALHSVGEKFPNAFGLLDMSGNVHEWTGSKYTRHYDNIHEIESLSTLSETNELMVIRGGSFASNERYLKATARGIALGVAYHDIGFRLLRIQ